MLFRSGLDYATAHKQLTEFLPVAIQRTTHYRLDRAVKPPTVALRDASPAEIGRLKGELERLEVGYVKDRFSNAPGIAVRYLDQAHLTLMRAYEQDSRDPRLLAAIGLWALDAGQPASAREFLEAAATGGSGKLRARASLELARLQDPELRRQEKAGFGTPIRHPYGKVPEIPVPPPRQCLSDMGQAVRSLPRNQEGFPRPPGNRFLQQGVQFSVAEQIGRAHV